MAGQTVPWRLPPVDPVAAQRAHAAGMLEVERHSREDTAQFNAVPGAYRMAQFFTSKANERSGCVPLDAKGMATFSASQSSREGAREAQRARSKFRLNPDGSRIPKPRNRIDLQALPQMTSTRDDAEPTESGSASRKKTAVGGTPEKSVLAKLREAERLAKERWKGGKHHSRADEIAARRAFDRVRKERESCEAKLGHNREGRGRQRILDRPPSCWKRFVKHHITRRNSVIVVSSAEELESGRATPKKKRQTAAQKARRGAEKGTQADRDRAAEAQAAVSLEKRKAACATVRSLGLSQRDLRIIKNQFELVDDDNSGDIDYGEFFGFIEEKPSPYTDAFFDLIDYDNNGCIDFEEWLIAMSTFAVYSQEQILRFCFETFDKDKSGDIDEFEFAGMIAALHDVRAKRQACVAV